MTSKEALEELRYVLAENPGTKKYSDIFEENLLRPIEKDLEILDIVKKHKLLNYVVKNEVVATFHGLDKEEIKILKEWLENDR